MTPPPGTAAPAKADSASTDAVLGIDRSQRPFYLRPLFLLTVVLPTLLSILYFGIFASSVYISESRFQVRSPTRATVSPLGAILSSSGLTGSGEETNAMMEYVQSRDALAMTDKDGLVRTAYGPERASWFDRFGGAFGGDSQEHLYDYFQDKVTIDIDPATQVAQLSVRAYSPKEAKAINQRLLEQSENLVNRLSDRAQKDAVTIAQSEVESAQDRARSAAIKLAQFRNEQGILDPEQEAEVRLQMISKLQDELIATRTQLQQIETYTPRASQIPYLRTRIKSLTREISEATAQIAGGRRSLSQSAAQYQELRLESEMAEKLLATTLTSLEEALADSRRKKAYVQRIAEPSLPDYAMEPRRWRGVLSTLLLSLLLWGVLSTLIAGIREHKD